MDELCSMEGLHMILEGLGREEGESGGGEVGHAHCSDP